MKWLIGNDGENDVVAEVYQPTGIQGITVAIPGYGDKTSQDGQGEVILITVGEDGIPEVLIWADINQEDPTHKISLAGAAENRRASEFVIFSPEGWWSNDDGWGCPQTATVFSAGERKIFNLPIGDAVRWLPAGSIGAEVHSDDAKSQTSFDATPWFEQAEDEEIENLAREDWKFGYASDAVALFFSDTDDPVGRVFEYIGQAHQGFGCSVDVESAMIWLDQNRPELAQQMREDEDIPVE